MQERIARFRSRRGQKSVLKLDCPHLKFEDRVAAMKTGHPKDKNPTAKRETEPGFPNSVIRQQIVRLRVHYLSDPELLKLPPEARRSEIRHNLYRFWDDAIAVLPKEIGLKEWVRDRIDSELQK